MTLRTLRTSILLAAALVLVPSLASAQTRRGTSRPANADSALRLGVLLGPEFADGDTGIALRGDAQMGISTLSPSVRLDGVVSLGYTRFSDDGPGFDLTTNLVRIVPAARFVFPVAPAVSLYGDAGIGLYIGSQSVDFDNNVFGDDDSESLFGINMRFAGGAMFDVSPTLALGAELALNPYFGDVDETTTTLMFGLQFRL